MFIYLTGGHTVKLRVAFLHKENYATKWKKKRKKEWLEKPRDRATDFVEEIQNNSSAL